jgi:hypothetical protein
MKSYQVLPPENYKRENPQTKKKETNGSLHRTAQGGNIRAAATPWMWAPITPRVVSQAFNNRLLQTLDSLCLCSSRGDPGTRSAIRDESRFSPRFRGQRGYFWGRYAAGKAFASIPFLKPRDEMGPNKNGFYGRLILRGRWVLVRVFGLAGFPQMGDRETLLQESKVPLTHLYSD